MTLRNVLARSVASRESRLASLRVDMDRSPVTEMKEMINSNGKLFEAPKNLLPGTTWRLAPDLLLRALDGQQYSLLSDLVSCRPASLLTISCSGFADPMVDSFRTPFLAHGSHSACGLIDLRPIPSRIKYALWSPLVRRSARRQHPPDLHASYFVYRGGKELRTMLDVPNLFGGYVYLLDREGLVRWRACGTATGEELDTMFGCIRQLVAS
jgi:ATPase complex subunit ATP10